MSATPNSTAPPDEALVDLKQLVELFLDICPEPTDEQLHVFSESLGIPYETFEEKVFQLFKDVLEDEADEDDLDDLEQDIAEDPLDLFIASFFLYMPEDPTEEQVHAFAQLIGVTPEELEERIYRMLQAFDDEDLDDENLDDADDLDSDASEDDAPDDDSSDSDSETL